jgi:integrase/recombinase XerD
MHEFSSVLGAHLVRFLAEKRAVGYRYETPAVVLAAFDRFLVRIGHRTVGLPQSLVDQWTRGSPHQAPSTRRGLDTPVRQFAKFLARTGIVAHVGGGAGLPSKRSAFVPYVFTHDQVGRLLAAVDSLRPHFRSPRRHLVFPTLFRLLYGCGLRCGEALRLTVRDVELDGGVVMIREGKFRQDRLVPVTSSVLQRLRAYSLALGPRSADAVFFAAPHGGSYSLEAPYKVFRRALRCCNISHGGRGRGPRVHDLRHTFAVHRLEQWFREGANLAVTLPVLATYMGHESILGTQRYLRLTAAVFPDLAERLDSTYGHLLPRGIS